MKTELLTHLIVDAEVRYWEDAIVDGKEDTDGTLIPFRSGDSWQPIIALATGKILDWPEGVSADIHYKVCDAGLYWLGDGHGKKLAKWRGHYVPDRYLCVNSRGFGDYIIFRVDPTGMIEGWTTPTIDATEWDPVDG